MDHRVWFNLKPAWHYAPDAGSRAVPSGTARHYRLTGVLIPDTLQSVLIGGVAGMISAVITHFSTRSKLRLDLAAEYDKKLQESRLEAYQKLWAMLEPLAKYGRGKVTYNILKAVSDGSRGWYFQTGGIYLTERSRKPYFDWKGALQALLNNDQLAREPEIELEDRLLMTLVETGSTLRTALSDDIGTKRLSRI